MAWGGSSATYETSWDHIAGSGISQNDYAVRTNTIPGGWDGSDPISTLSGVYHTYRFVDVNGDLPRVTLSSNSTTITLPDMTTQTFDPSAHERRAFGERYGMSASQASDDAWPYITAWSWKVYNPVGGDITNGYGHSFFNGSIVTHPTGNGTTWDADHTWYVQCGASWNGGVFAAGSYVEFDRTIQIMDDNGPQTDISGDYNRYYVPVSSGGPDVRFELKSGRDGNAGDGPYFGCEVLTIGTFDVSTSGLPVPVGAGKPTTIITS